MAKSWRDVLPIHPAAELFPSMSADELKTQAANIKKGWLTGSIIVLTADGRQVVDGRSRLNALELAGLPALNADGLPEHYRCLEPNEDPFAVAISLNLERRHLTQEQKRQVIIDLKKARPASTDREIARQTKSSPTTVGKVLKEAILKEANVQSGHKPPAQREEASGRRARGVKPGTRRSKEETAMMRNSERMASERQQQRAEPAPVPPVEPAPAAELPPGMVSRPTAPAYNRVKPGADFNEAVARITAEDEAKEQAKAKAKADRAAAEERRLQDFLAPKPAPVEPEPAAAEPAAEPEPRWRAVDFAEPANTFWAAHDNDQEPAICYAFELAKRLDEEPLRRLIRWLDDMMEFGI